ncbi:methylated-DNA--[protein]-cysteine S-methyltransferase [Marinobacter changyiensis]|uniref:methylated-DNA--[protein]-cysteine S-methyltransferase n=1 Tax=Marinobacter changyiensis TaxID=2604091 RepID=UPI0015D13B0D|nr:methylated-DNA--[protein]-cysteine S-methyltransferase [Marinobacter changyiensis]
MTKDQRLHELCRYIEANSSESLTLEHLSGLAHMSPDRFQRRFKEVIGVTPKQYADACRLRALKQNLRVGNSVTDAVFAAGFGSTSRVYERASSRLGMTPGQYRAGGRNLEISWASAATPVGQLLMAATDRGLCFVELGDEVEVMHLHLAEEFPEAVVSEMPEGGSEPFWQWMDALCGTLQASGSKQATGSKASGSSPELPVDIRGTAFQVQVWDYLRQIPRGELRTYKEVAQAIGRPKAVRAVASACGANRVALAIPCHRVIRGDGGLGGYRWGIERKRQLLAIENP